MGAQQRLQNDYDKEVYNGDLGFIARIDPDAAEVVIAFEGRDVAYDFGELDQLVPAYATTVHKAQGSEYPAVVIPLVTQHFTMLRRNLVYTAVTRGQRLVVIVGQPKALALAVRGAQTRRRWSKLGEWLGGEPEPAGQCRTWPYKPLDRSGWRREVGPAVRCAVTRPRISDLSRDGSCTVEPPASAGPIRCLRSTSTPTAAP